MTTIILFLAFPSFAVVAGAFGAQLREDLSRRPACPVCIALSASATALGALGAVASLLVLGGVLP